MSSTSPLIPLSSVRPEGAEPLPVIDADAAGCCGGGSCSVD
ncbi:hypothetical protein AB0N73_14640 [Microbacterium sp. NPDC089189]